MISTRAAATLLFITLNMQRAAASSPKGTKKRRPVPKPEEVLVDATNDVSPVKVQDGSTGMIDTSQELSVPQVDDQFMTLIEKGEYEKIFELGKKISDEEFLKRLCQVIETLEQYRRVVDYLKSRNLVALFYVYGDIEVVREVVVESVVYDDYNYYTKGGDLETALSLALEKDLYDRFIELLDFRKQMTAEDDEPFAQGTATSFDIFLCASLENLAPCEDGMALRRFLILLGDELRNKYGDIFDTFCRELVAHLSFKLDLPKAKGLLLDLIGQPSLLTPVVFVRGILFSGSGEFHSTFIKYGWGEAIQEGLKGEYPNGGKELWRVMQKEKLAQFPGEFPDTEEALTAACAHFPTKQQKEDEWIKKYFMIIFDQLNDLDFLPTVLWSIISEYAVLFIAAMDSAFSKK